MKNQDKIAVFIDAENVSHTKIAEIFFELNQYGIVNERRAYANWASGNLKPWAEVLNENAIVARQQFALCNGKNAADMALTIDVVDLLHTKKLDIICIISSDSDFTPLVIRCLWDGVRVFGFGESKAPKSFVKSCTRFIYIDNNEFVKPSKTAKTDSSKQPEAKVSDKIPKNKSKKGVKTTKASSVQVSTCETIKIDANLLRYLRHVCNSVKSENGWSNLANVGTKLSKNKSFKAKQYGFNRLKKLIQATSIFDIKVIDNNPWIKEKVNKPELSD